MLLANVIEVTHKILNHMNIWSDYISHCLIACLVIQIVLGLDILIQSPTIVVCTVYYGVKWSLVPYFDSTDLHEYTSFS